MLDCTLEGLHTVAVILEVIGRGAAFTDMDVTYDTEAE